MDRERLMWERLSKEGYNDFGVAAVIGNIFAESGLESTNLQNTFNKKFGMTDAEYTAKVDNGTYKNFINDKAGYGLAQWTFYTRKEALYNYLKSKGKSIGDFEGQLEFLCIELRGYTKVTSVLNRATSVKEASNAVLFDFENPANKSESVQNKRASYSQVYYDKYAKSNVKEDSTMSNSSLVNCVVKSPNHSGKRTHAIDTLTPHCVVGQLGAEAIGGCFTSPSRSASCNYGIGVDGRVVLCVDECNRSWCTSSNENDQRAVTIECASDKTEPYAFNTTVYNKLIELCVDICRRNGKNKVVWLGSKEKELAYVPKSNEMRLTAHRWFANKSCPGNWLYSRYAELANAINKALGSGSSTPTPAPTPSTPSSSGTKFAKGDVVNFKGNKHYVSSTGNSGSACKPGKATITAEAKGAAHPYHVVAVKGEGSTVYGWVNETDLAKIGSSGSSKFPYRVKVKIPDLNIRRGPGTNTDKVGKYTGIGVFTIVEEADGPGASKWGLLSSYKKNRNGWISLDSDFCDRL